MNKKIIMIGCMTLLLVGCNKSANHDAPSKEVGAEKVKTTTLTRQTIQRQLELSTTLLGYETVNISPSVTGAIEHIFVDVGSRVSKGQLLVRMDRSQYNSTKMAYANLGVELTRTEALKESGSISQQTYDRIKLQYDQTRENLQFLEQNTFVKAPLSGVIAAKNYENGELYSGQPILILTQTNVLKALISIPENNFPLIKKGQKVTLVSEIYPDQTFDATVETVFPTIDPSSHTFQAKLRIPNYKDLLRPGMYVRTVIFLGQVNVLMVPYQTILKVVGANDRYIFVNNGGIAKRMDVTLGQRVNEQIEISGDSIKEGLEIVTTGQAKLVDGTKLDIVESH